MQQRVKTINRILGIFNIIEEEDEPERILLEKPEKKNVMSIKL